MPVGDDAHHARQFEQGQDALVNEVNAGLNGQLGLNHNEFYNPFGNSMLVASSSPQYNTPDLYNDIVYLVNNTYESTLYSFDGVVTGDIARLQIQDDRQFQGDAFDLNNSGVEIRIVKVANGNYGIRQVN